MGSIAELGRADFLGWARGRALEYLDRDDPAKAFLSMTSDLQKHSGTAGLTNLQRAMLKANDGRPFGSPGDYAVFVRSPEKVRAFIEAVE